MLFPTHKPNRPRPLAFRLARSATPWLLALCLVSGLARLAAAEDPPAIAAEAPSAAEGENAPSPAADAPATAPQRRVPSLAERERNPIGAGQLLMELSERAEDADRERDSETAIRTYRQLAELIPDRALAFSRLCAWYKTLGQRNDAIATCRRANTLEGVQLIDYLRFMSLLLETPPGQELSTAEIAELDGVYAHLEKQEVKEADADIFMCQLAVRLEDIQRLRHCLDQLERKMPGSALSIPYQFTLALLLQDERRAQLIIQAAESLGLAEDGVASMQRQLDERSGGPARRQRWAVGLGLGGLLAAAGAGLFWQRRRRGPAAPVELPAAK